MTVGPAGSGKPAPISTARSARDVNTPSTRPEGRAGDADDPCLEQHGFQHLRPARAQQSQRRQLPAALGEHDRERVVDDEDADEQRDGGEGEQEGVEESQVLVQIGLLRSLCLGGPTPPRANRSSSAPRTSATSRSGRTDPSPETTSVSKAPGSPKRRCAVSVSVMASEAPGNPRGHRRWRDRRA